MVLHQIIAGAAPHDAITDHALRLRVWLHERDITSEIYAGHIETGYESPIRPLHSYRDQGESHLIYHHGLGSDVADTVIAIGKPLILIYHNVTPHHFFSGIDPAKAAASQRGRAQLAQLQPQTAIALGISAVNTAELQANSFTQTAVLPIALEPELYRFETSSDIVARKGDRPILLFVGRLAPNKRQEDLVKLLYAYQQIEPHAQLALVGNRWSKDYVNWINTLASQLGVQQSLWLPGRVSQADLVSYYRNANLYISMSEHEGFGKPYLEAMHHQLPILAFQEPGTTDTLGSAGVQFKEKNFAGLAELIDLILNDRPWQIRLVQQQTERLARFSPAVVKQQFAQILTQLNL